MNLFQFLNAQGGATIFFFGLFILIILGIIGDTITKSFKYIAKAKETKRKVDLNSDEQEV